MDQQRLGEYVFVDSIEDSDFGLEFRNIYGCLRWNKIHSAFLCNDVSVEDVYSLYQEWVDDTEYLVMQGKISGETIFLKASKRGNDVYQRLVEDKLSPLNDVVEHVHYMDDFHNEQHYTKLLFLTLTQDTKKCGLITAWDNIGPDWNRFLSNLRKQFGKIEFFRTWESTKKGYPHIHVLVGFVDARFPVLRHVAKKGKDKGKVTFRIPFNYVEKIQSYWHSHIDVQCVAETKGAVRELTKYITKDLCSKKGYNTNAMICLFNKQSYAVSKNFLTLLEAKFDSKGFARLKGLLNYDFTEPDNNLLLSALYNSNHDGESWEFVGVLRGKHLGFGDVSWVVRVKEPPPKIKDLVDFERERQFALERDRYG